MIRYTTPTIQIRVKGIDLTEGYRVLVTLRSLGTDITVDGPPMTLDGTDTLIEVQLSQEQTAQLYESTPVHVQVNWVDREGMRNATERATLDVAGNLLDKVVPYE